MLRKTKKLLIIITAIALLICVVTGAVFLTGRSSDNKEEASQVNISNLKKMGYDKVYYLQTEYKNQTFISIIDVPLYPDSYREIYAPEFFQDTVLAEEDPLGVTSSSVKANTVIEEYMYEKTYYEKINGYSTFELSEIVTTVVLKDKDGYYYARVFVDDKTKDPNVLVKEFIDEREKFKEMNEGVEVEPGDGSIEATNKQIKAWLKRSEFKEL